MPPTAEPLGFPSVVRDLDWEDDVQRYEEVGEQWGAPRKYDKRDPPDIAGLTHVCGEEEDFRRGASSPANPPVVYAPDGLPACCRPVPDAVVMGGVPPVLDLTAVVLGGGYTPASIGAYGYGETPGDVLPLNFEGDPMALTWIHHLGPTVFARLYGPGVYPGSGPTEWVLIEYAGPTEWRVSAWDGVGPKEFPLTSGSGWDPAWVVNL